MSAAEAHNKAALIASDCGLSDLAQQLCWRQFDIFHAATPLPAKTAKLALQPIVNLGRLLTRRGHSDRAYEIFQNVYNAVENRTGAGIDGRHIDFSNLTVNTGERQELRRFLWTVLLADGTRALTRAGRWSEALQHIEQHNGIGKRMLDGRQVAILASCAAGDYIAAIGILENSLTSDPWEQAITAYLRVLCLHVNDRPAHSATATMLNHYLHLGPTPRHPIFRARLGLCVLDLIDTSQATRATEISAGIVQEAVTSADAYIGRDVLSHTSHNLTLAETDRDALATLVESSGLDAGTIQPELLNNVMTAVRISEAELVQLLR